MKVNISLGLFVTAILAASNYASAAVFNIGDNDGYGLGIPDGGSHVFNPVPPEYDQRSADEAVATNGAQFTDTFSTTHPGFSPQEGTLATFTFSGLDQGWSSAELLVDMAEFQASEFGPTRVSINGVRQDWNFDDGFGNTAIHRFNLSQAILKSIVTTGELIINVDRNNSADYYGFDYLQLTTSGGASVNTPIPPAVWLFGSALAFLGSYVRRKKGY